MVNPRDIAGKAEEEEPPKASLIPCALSQYCTKSTKLKTCFPGLSDQSTPKVNKLKATAWGPYSSSPLSLLLVPDAAVSTPSTDTLGSTATVYCLLVCCLSEPDISKSKTTLGHCQKQKIILIIGSLPSWHNSRLMAPVPNHIHPVHWWKYLLVCIVRLYSNQNNNNNNDDWYW